MRSRRRRPSSSGRTRRRSGCSPPRAGGSGEVAELDVVGRGRVGRSSGRAPRARRRRPLQRAEGVTRPLASGSAPSGTGSATSRLALGSRIAFCVCSAIRLTKKSGCRGRRGRSSPLIRRVSGRIAGDGRQRAPRAAGHERPAALCVRRLSRRRPRRPRGRGAFGAGRDLVAGRSLAHGLRGYARAPLARCARAKIAARSKG